MRVSRVNLAMIIGMVAIMYVGIPVQLCLDVEKSCLGTVAQANNDQGNQKQGVQISRSLASLPLSFTENLGQWDEKVLFRANAGGATMWFTTGGAYYQFTHRIETVDKGTYPVVDKISQIATDKMDREPDSVETIVIRAAFVGANPNPRMIGVDLLDYKCNYFIGNDPDKWHTNVSNYQAVVYEDVYSGIDLKYYGNGKQMEYDFIVSPGADPSQIFVQYEGAKSLDVNEAGELVVRTEWGAVIEQKPLVYQMVDDGRDLVECQYALIDDNVFSFYLPSGYDAELTLVIDPVLSYSTYLGSGGTDWGYRIAVDNSGSAYVTGYTDAGDFPTQNPYHVHQAGRDVFVAKLNSSGTSLVYSTYLGGSGSDAGKDISIDGSGNAYVTGDTYSGDFPTTLGAYDPSGNGGGDVFVTKLNSAGNGLVYSTVIGGSGQDVGYGIGVDGDGNTYITGFTVSSDFPIQSAHQATRPGGYDAFIAKLSSDGSSLVFSTYLGGSGADFGYDVAVDGSGNAYATGETSSGNFPSQNPYQATHQGGPDVFVTKVDNAGSLVYSTYLGGGNNDGGYAITVDGNSNAYITGTTRSVNFPTQNPYQTDPGDFTYDAFVTKLSSLGNSLVYSTYIGGTGRDDGIGIAVDNSGNAYVVGYTDAGDFPTQNPFQVDQPGRDVFIAKLNSSGTSLVYSTYLGGGLQELGYDVSLDGSGNAYVTGRTNSSDFPIQNPIQSTNAGSYDAFVAKISASLLIVALDIRPGACPNPLNVNRGIYAEFAETGDLFTESDNTVLWKKTPSQPGPIVPVAILGTADFDVTQIDPTSIMLVGVAPFDWNLQDVGTPTVNGIDCECNSDGPDGFTDLWMKFSRTALVAAIGDVYRGDIVPLTLTGSLLDELPITGQDCVVIVGGPPVDNNISLALAAFPNPFNPSTTISFTLTEASDYRLTIYNVTGQVVDSRSGQAEAGQVYLQWDAGGHASGVYLYRLEAGELTETRKMLLLK